MNDPNKISSDKKEKISAIFNEFYSNLESHLAPQKEHPHVELLKGILGFIFQLPNVKEQNIFLYWFIKIIRYPITILLCLWVSWRFAHPIIDWLIGKYAPLLSKFWGIIILAAFIIVFTGVIYIIGYFHKKQIESNNEAKQ